MTRPFQHFLSAMKERTIQLTKRLNTDAAQHDTHGKQQTRPPLTPRRVLDSIRVKGRIDFIRQLPVEIVMTRLIPMLMHNADLDSSIPCAYFHVSQLWCDRIAQCFGGLHFNIHWEEEYNKEKCSQLAQFAQYATRLSISWYKDWIADVLYVNNLCSLRELHIQGLSDEETGRRFFSALRKIGSTLTHLFIQFNHLPLSDLLSACPNLLSLELQCLTHDIISSLPPTTWTKLTTLHIGDASQWITRDQVITVCKHFPSLKKLHLSSCSDIQSVLVVTQYLPSMTRLDMTISGDKVCFTYFDQGNACGAQGITHVSIRGHARRLVKDICSALSMYHTTLVQLNWNLVVFTNDDIYSIHLTCLKKLVLSSSGCWILRNAPLLEELEISANAIDNHPAVLDTTPPKLDKLKLRLYPTPNFYMTRVEHYLNRFAQQKMSRLKELIIETHTLEDLGKMHEPISRLEHLERLMIHCWPWNPSQFESFLQGLVKGCRQLKSLEMRCPNTPSTYSINALKRLGCLRHFAFSIRGTKDDDCFWDAIESFSQLKCIEMHPAVAISTVRLRRLREQRPDLKIMARDAYIHI